MIESPQLNRYVKKMTELTISKSLWEISKGFHIEKKGNEYIPCIQEHMQNGTVIVPFNHPSLVDPMIVIHQLLENFDLEIQNFIFLASMKFFDGRMGPIASPLIEYMKQYGVKLEPVIQPNDSNYTERQRRDHNTPVFRKLKKLCQTDPEGLLIGIAPGGTRTVEMNRAQGGFDFLVKSADMHGLVAPIALHNTHHIHTKDQPWYRTNLLAKVSAEFLPPIYGPNLVGELANYHSNGYKEMTMGDAVMYRIAQAVSTTHRGVYSTYPPMEETSQFIMQSK